MGSRLIFLPLEEIITLKVRILGSKEIIMEHLKALNGTIVQDGQKIG